MLSSFRARLIITVIALVAVTAGFVATAAYVLVRNSLRDQLVADAVSRAEFNVGVLASADQLPADADSEVFEASGLADRFLLRGAGGVYIEFDGDTFASSLALLGAGESLSSEVRGIVGRGEFGYEFLTLDGDPVLVVGGRRPPTGPDFYFFFSAATVDETMSQVLRVLLIAGAGAVMLGALAASLVARRVLRPVAIAGRAAEAMADGDLSVRLPAESRDEFGTWAEAFNRMALSLERQMAALVNAQERERRFVADVSHELRTPTTALVNEAAMLERHLESLPDSGRHVGAMLVGDVDRLRRLIEELLEISRLEAGGPVELSPVDLEGFLGAVIEDRHPGTTLYVTGAESPVRVDRRGLERIVGNLLDNARRHAPDAPCSVTAHVDSDAIQIEVRDEGRGVSDEELGRLFDRFYKADSSRHGGSGLGLAIARQHARRLGGELTARRGPRSGLVFELLMPVSDLLRAGDAGATSPFDADGGSADTTTGRSS